MADMLKKELKSRISGLVKDSIVTDFFDVTIDNVPNYKQGAYRGRIMNEFQPITKASYHEIYIGFKIPFASNDKTINTNYRYKKEPKEEPEVKEEPGKLEKVKNFIKSLYPIADTPRKSAIKNKIDWSWNSNPKGYTNGKMIVDGYRELQNTMPWTEYDDHSNTFFNKGEGVKDVDGKMKTLKEIYDERRLYCIDEVKNGSECNLKDLGGYRERHYVQRLDDPVNRIHQWGCLLTCMADIFSYYKKQEITPPMVNDKMNEMNKKAEMAEFEAKCEEILKKVPGNITPYTASSFEKPGVYNTQSGYAKGSSNMMTNNVAIAYGYRAITSDSPNIMEKEDKDKYDQKFFLDRIKKRVNNKKPTIVKLVAGEKTHFVLVVGISYYGRSEDEEAAFYIINDPGAHDGSDMGARYINCKTGYSDHWKRTIVSLITVD